MNHRPHSMPRSIAILATIPLLGLLSATAAPSAAPAADRPRDPDHRRAGAIATSPSCTASSSWPAGPATPGWRSSDGQRRRGGGRGRAEEEFTGYGVDAFVYLVNHDQANDPAMVRQLDSATGIWFGGGDQLHLTDALGGTASLRAIQARYRAGAVLGGTSAGAAIMSDSMITGNQSPPGDTTGYYGDEFPAIAPTASR